MGCVSGFSINYPDSVKIGAVGAAEAACTDLGSIKSFTFTPSPGETIEVTSMRAGGSVVGSKKWKKGATVAVVFEEPDLALLAYALDGTVVADSLDLATTPACSKTYTLYCAGLQLDDDVLVHIYKAEIVSVDPLGVEGAQGSMAITFRALPDATNSNSLGTVSKVTADATAPTISSVSPIDGAAAVAKAISTLVVWTFSEAIRTEDATAEHFFVTDDTGNVKAGTLSVGTSNTVVTFTPSAAWAATTKYLPCVVQGVRDTAGNELAATSITDFTTGA